MNGQHWRMFGKEKVQEMYVFQYSAAKYIKLSFTQTKQIKFLEAFRYRDLAKFYPERGIKLVCGVGGREGIRALWGEVLYVP